MESLENLKISDLRKLHVIPKKITKKSEIVAFIRRKEESLSKKTCRLCSGSKQVWSELGLMPCPLCQELKIDSIKQEEYVDKELLADLVLKGFGVCESMDSLKGFGNDIEKCANYLLAKTRNSAENYFFEQAQLNSEEAGQIARREEKISIAKNRDNISTDISEFVNIHPGFAEQYIFQSDSENGLIEWIAEATNAVSVYDYLSVRKNAIKWYKGSAIVYFEQSERENLKIRPQIGYHAWFTDQVKLLEETLYSIPESSGAIPLLFRGSNEVIQTDIDIEMLEVIQNVLQVVNIDD